MNAGHRFLRPSKSRRSCRRRGWGSLWLTARPTKGVGPERASGARNLSSKPMGMAILSDLRASNNLSSLHSSSVSRDPSPTGQFLQQRLALAEPRPLAPLHIPRQCPLLCEQLLRPLTRLFPPVRRLQKTRVVVKRLRSRRNLRDLRKKLIRAFQLTRLRIRVRQQSRRSTIIELPVARDHSLQVRNRRR